MRATDIDPSEYVALGAAVRGVRARLRLTQEQAGKRAGLHHNYIGAIERGEVNPTFRMLRKIGDGLDVSLSSLMAIYETERASRRQGE